MQRQNQNGCFDRKIGIWCNGNTTDSGPVILGSNPGSSTPKTRSLPTAGFSFPATHAASSTPLRRGTGPLELPARKSRRVPCAKEPPGPARVPRTGTHKSKDRLPSPFTRSDRTSGRPVRRTAPRRLFRSTNPCRLKQDGVQAKKNRKTGVMTHFDV